MKVNGTRASRGDKVQLNVLIPPALDHAFREHCVATATPMNVLIAQLLLDYLREHGNALVQGILDGKV